MKYIEADSSWNSNSKTVAHHGTKNLNKMLHEIYMAIVLVPTYKKLDKDE